MFENFENIDWNDPPSWPDTVKAIVAGIICVLIIAAAYYFKVRHQVVSLEQVERQEQQLKETFKEKKALAINLEAYREQLIQADDMFSLLKEQLPNKNEIPELLVDVTQLGLSRGLQFERFKPIDEVSKGFYTEKPVNLIVNGNYHQLAQFVSDVASLPRIINVENFKITRKTEGSDLKMEAVTKTYYYDDQGGNLDEEGATDGQ